MIRIGGIGIGAMALVCGAGAALAQPLDPDDSWPQRPRWTDAERPPAAPEEDPVYLRSTRTGHEVVLRLHEGRIAARLDGEPARRDQIQVRGSRVRVLTHDGRTAAIFRLPPGLVTPPGTRDGMAMRDGVMGQGMMDDGMMGERAMPRRRAMPREGWADDEPREARFRIEEQWLDATGRPLWNLGHPRAVLGVLMAEAGHAALAQHEKYGSGVRVEQVHEGLPAAEAGLKKGDIIVEAGGERDLTPHALRHLVHESGPGETLDLKVLRDGREQTIEVTLRPFEPEKLNWDFVLPMLMDEGRGRYHAAPQRPFVEDEPRQPREPRGEDADEPAPADRADRPRLGITIAEAPPEALADVKEHSSGVLVQDVQQGQPGAEAGLKSGDIIVEFNGQKVESPASLQERVNAMAAGESIELTIIRDGQEQVVKVSLPE